MTVNTYYQSLFKTELNNLLVDDDEGFMGFLARKNIKFNQTTGFFYLFNLVVSADEMENYIGEYEMECREAVVKGMSAALGKTLRINLDQEYSEYFHNLGRKITL